MAEESTRIVHGPTFKNLLDNVTKLEKQTQKKTCLQMRKVFWHRICSVVFWMR